MYCKLAGQSQVFVQQLKVRCDVRSLQQTKNNFMFAF